MKKTFLAKLPALLAGCALMFVSCSDLLNISGDSSDKGSEKTYVTLSLADIILDGAARTAMPETNASSFSKFELKGVPSNTANSTVTWETSTNNAKNELKSAHVTVVKDETYTFTLTATTENGTVYEDSCEKKIEATGNTLTFNLRLIKLGTSGTGNVEIKIKLPVEDGKSESAVQKVTVTVYRVGEDGTVSSVPEAEFDGEEIEIRNGKAIFRGEELDAGTYKAAFTLWNSDTSDAKVLDTWTEYFVIQGGLTSKSTMNDDGTNTIDNDVEENERTFILDFDLGDEDGAEQGSAQ